MAYAIVAYIELLIITQENVKYITMTCALIINAQIVGLLMISVCTLCDYYIYLHNFVLALLLCLISYSCQSISLDMDRFNNLGFPF